MMRSPVADGHNPPLRRRRRRRTALAASLLLAACAPPSGTEIRFASPAPPNPVTAASAPAHFTDREFIADDGARLPLRKWLPRDGVKAVILALHGFGDYSNAFAMPAPLWAERGIATYAFDQRGFGGAPGRGLWPGAEWLAADAIAASRLLRQTYPGAPQFQPGDQFVLFLWTGRSGMTQIMGFSQGVFAVARDGSPDPILTREASHEMMLDPVTHSQVNDQPLTMRLSELRSQVSSALGVAK